MPLLDHTGNAVPTTIVSGANNPTSISIVIQDATGWPTGGANGKFWVTIARDQSSEEHVLIQSRSGTTLTIASTGDRGRDGTVAGSHAPGTTIEHTTAAEEFDELNDHLFNIALDTHTQYMKADGTRHDLTARHLLGTSVPASVTPGNIAIGDVAALGSSNNAARADHRHGAPSFGSPVSIGTALAAGGSTSLARADHVHELGVGSIDTLSFVASSLLRGVVQDADPGAIGANVMWLQGSTRTLFVRNAANSGWEEWAFNLDAAWTTYDPTNFGGSVTLGSGGTKWGRFKKYGSMVVGVCGFSLGVGGDVTALLEAPLPTSISPTGVPYLSGARARIGGAFYAGVGEINEPLDTNAFNFATAGQPGWNVNLPVAAGWNNGDLFFCFYMYETTA